MYQFVPKVYFSQNENLIELIIIEIIIHDKMLRPNWSALQLYISR